MKRKYTHLIPRSVGCCYAAVIAAIAALAGACSPKSDDVFDASPAQRQQQAIRDYAALLTAPEYGWAMDFYPSDMAQGGIAYTARFTPDEVELATEMLIDNAKGDKVKYAAGQTVTSEYDIIPGQGIMLTFDTYNPLMHYWSQPSGTQSEGLATDYEFTFVSATADEVVLRGCKYGHLLRLYPLHEDAATYLGKVIAMRAALCEIPRKRAVVDGRSLPVTAMSSHLLYDDDDGSAQDVPYTYTAAGIRFYEPVTLGGVTVGALTFDDTTRDLTSADGRVQLPLPTPLEQFCGTVTQWHFIYGNTDASYDMCDELREIVKTFITRTSKENNEFVDDIYVGMNKQLVQEDAQRTVIGWSTSTSMVGVWYELRYGLDMTVVSEDGFLIRITPLDGGLYTANYPQVVPFLDFIRNNNPYALQFDDILNPRYVRLVSQQDPSKWFALKL
ncbi:MAG: DUF4302 domain-containing protein [Bacteroidaceae bacterium]|nr:DUF4302 domain-containing protein [Bacteroidaceae bacterium]